MAWNPHLEQTRYQTASRQSWATVTSVSKTFTMLGAPAAPEAGQLPGDAASSAGGGVALRGPGDGICGWYDRARDGPRALLPSDLRRALRPGPGFVDLRGPDPRRPRRSRSAREALEPRIKGAVFVRGLSEYQVASAADVLALVARGTKGRATRATRSNEHSSRSHAVLQLALEVESVEKGNDENNDPARWSQFAASDVPPSTAQTPGTAGTRTVVRRAKLSLVDLAGSERSDEVAASQQFARELGRSTRR